MAKYVYMPICPYCGMKVLDVIEHEEITKPQWVRAVRTCIWCGKEMMEYDVIEPGELLRDDGLYMQLMRNLEDPEFREGWKKKARDILCKTE